MLKIKQYFLIIAGCLVFSAGVVWFADAAGLVTGGFSGIAIIVNRISGLPLFVTNLVLNIPLFVISARWRGVKFVARSFFAMMLSSFFMFVFDRIKPPFNLGGDLFLTAVLSGASMGVGLGLVMSTFTTTGGTDMLASVIKHRASHISVPVIMLVTDAIIIVSGAFIFGLGKSVYGIISLIICSKLLDLFLSGLNFSKAVFIISENQKKISDRISSEAGRGSTLIFAEGMYTGKRRNMLFAVVSAKEAVKIKEIVKSVDEKAFMFVCSVSEVIGEGFSSINKQEF